MLILVLLILVGVSLFLHTLTLWLSTKIFGIRSRFGTTFKIVLLVGVCSAVFALVLSLLMKLVGIGAWTAVMAVVDVVVNFLIFNYVMRRHHKTGTQKNLAIYVVDVVFGLVAAIVIFFPLFSLRVFVVEPFTVSGGAMNPNFTHGQYILLEKWDKRFQRGDVVVFRYPQDPSQYFIKRIVGLPGDVVSIRDGQVYINDEPLDESGYLPPALQSQTFGGSVPVKVQPDKYFVLGDNRLQSSDSRVWGTVSGDAIVGKYWTTPFSR